MQTQTIGEFLLRRLEATGVHHIFGVAGDYDLELLQRLEDRGRPAWVGNCNELNASSPPHDGLVFVESVMDPRDAPKSIILSGQATANEDCGPRGPHTRPGARLDAPLNGR